MGATTSLRTAVQPRPRRPGDPRRRGWREPLALPPQPTGVEILAAIAYARAYNPPDFGDPKVVDPKTRQHAWDAGIESSCIAVLTYLWRRGRSEKWAGREGSARFACSLEQLVVGLAPIMEWHNVPERGEGTKRRRFVNAHRRSVQRWLDWLQAAGLASHQPCRDPGGFWWRTIVTLHACPALPADLLADAADRRSQWVTRERRRQLRGTLRARQGQSRPRRNLDAILRRARLSAAERRARSRARRQTLAEHAQRLRVRALVQKSLQTHLAHPCGAEATPQSFNPVGSKKTSNRRHAHAKNDAQKTTNRHDPPKTAATKEPGAKRDRTPETNAATRNQSEISNLSHLTDRSAGGDTTPQRPEAIRDKVYNEIANQRWYYGTQPRTMEQKLERMAGADGHWASAVHRQARRLEALGDGRTEGEGPVERWRLLEAWAVRAHGPQMAAAGGFRLAFFNEERHGSRLNRALKRYGRHSQLGAPAGWPTAPIAGFATWIAAETRAQDGATHGIAADIARFDAFTKDLAAYAQEQDPDRRRRAEQRAIRRQQRQALAEQVNQRLSFRIPSSDEARLKIARELLDSDYEPSRRQGAHLLARLNREQQLERRDQALVEGRNPGIDDGRHIRACRHAERWQLPNPTPS
jgi:hypothetical protein